MQSAMRKEKNGTITRRKIAKEEQLEVHRS